jgi:hypothetical protein
MQRSYRARLAAAGKIVRLGDVAPVELGLIQEMRDELHDQALRLERREQDVARLVTRNAYLEGELKLQEQHLTNALKDIVMLKQKLEQR